MRERQTTRRLKSDRVSLHLWQENLRRLIYAATMILSVVFIGTFGYMILGIDKPGQPMLINPPGETRLQAGDYLLAIGNDQQLEILQSLVD